MVARVCPDSGVPEILEAELTRRAALDLIGRRFGAVERTDSIVVGAGVDELVPGCRIERIDRRGKLLLFVTDSVVIGVHGGMTGRLLRDGSAAAVGELAYGARSDHERWDRWVVRLDDGTRLRFHDPRRLGRVSLDPSLERLGPDALSVTRVSLGAALAGRRGPLKSVLLDQGVIAGLGNMLADEVLWWSGISPRRTASSLDAAEIAALHGAIRRRLPVMLRRGGSHTGSLSPAVRTAGALCPRDGAALARDVIGGRTTIWCPWHQH